MVCSPGSFPFCAFEKLDGCTTSIYDIAVYIACRTWTNLRIKWARWAFRLNSEIRYDWHPIKLFALDVSLSQGIWFSKSMICCSGSDSHWVGDSARVNACVVNRVANKSYRYWHSGVSPTKRTGNNLKGWCTRVALECEEFVHVSWVDCICGRVHPLAQLIKLFSILLSSTPRECRTNIGMLVHPFDLV